MDGYGTITRTLFLTVYMRSCCLWTMAWIMERTYFGTLYAYTHHPDSNV